MPNTTILIVAAAGLIVISLAILLIRGRFSTAERRADLALQEMATAAGLPKKLLARGAANSLGHTADSSQLRGAGLLWLDDDRLGFLLRRPARQFEIPLIDIQNVAASNEFSRVGMTQTSEELEFLVVNWTDRHSPAMIGFRVKDPEKWAVQVNEAVKLRRRRRTP